MKKNSLYLILILGLAALIRLFHLNHGLPEIYEEATPMRHALQMWQGHDGTFDFNPHFFNYPALYFYIQFIGQFFYFLLNLLVGRFDHINDMFLRYHSDPTEIVLLARLINTLFGVGAVWAIHHLGCLLRNKQTAILAAILLSIMPISVHTSRIILVDTPLLFFGILSLIFIRHLFHNNTLTNNLWAGIWMGLATASKYTGALFVIPFITAHMLHHRSLSHLFQHKKQITIGLLSAAIIFFISNPYIALDFKSFWADFSFERAHMALGHFGVDANNTQTTYFKDLWHNFYFSLTPCLLWGIFLIGKHTKSHRQEIPLWLFTAIYLTWISTWSMHAAHYLLPIMPPLVLITAIGIQDVLTRINASVKIAIPIVLFIIAPTGIHTFQYLINNAKPDARLEAKNWITHHIPQGALIGKEHYTPDLSANTYNLLRLPMDAIIPEVISPFYDIHWYSDFDYIITSEGVSARYQNQPQKFSTQIQFYKDLQTHWTRVATFSGDHFSGPAIHIYKNPNPTSPHRLYTAQQYDKLIGANNHVATDLLTRLADLFAQKNWHQKAMDVYEHVLPITLQKEDILYKMGTLFYQMGHLDRAQHMWQQALQNTPQNIVLLTNLGAIALQQGHTQKAIQYWEQGLQQAPADPDLVNNLVFIYGQIGQSARAIQILQNAIQINPSDTTFQLALRNLQTP